MPDHSPSHFGVTDAQWRYYAKEQADRGECEAGEIVITMPLDQWLELVRLPRLTCIRAPQDGS